jgi:sugar (pentulose or hexulose) kinase
MKYYLGIDLGTTGTKSILFDENSNVLSKGYKGYNLITPFENFFEQNAEDWYDAVVESVKEATSAFNGEVSGVSVSAQGGSFLLCDIDKFGDIVPLTNAITWMDKRAEVEAKELYDSVYNETGVKLTKSSPLALLLWLKKNKPQEFNRAKLILSTSDYIYYKLTGKAVIDYTSAGMMGVIDNENLCYDNKLLSFVGLSDSKFPKVVSAGEFTGYVNDKFLSQTGLKGKISLYAGLHDQVAGSLGGN